ncbi:uncharacterized protein UMAG_15020 [Mycosarcoma maydis]|uniref:DUF7137 domain-containing protein n=1 Tax=Mycosarcoma maydis TaxID=5270 RepID=A0A0D1EAQ6_MYCMD|nr:uncharacterized protein UMAG_15020 [Ustilago maydis 521]KIS72326.1 hypothetical protein UMAG_15020 [Ustilago maydis 521]|eukprot:XP_011386856.1 hypothetical protein UMAG_15020 [Ustilago maydis 521]
MTRMLPFLCAIWALICLEGALAPDPPTFTPGLPTAQPGPGSQAQATSTGASSINIPSSAPVGGITMTQPIQTADPSYYKIARGVDVTTATSVCRSPYNYSTSVEVSNPNLPQLIAASYRLLVYDERGLSVGASPGLMQANTKVEFALYNPQAYTPLASGWVCAACSGASGLKMVHPGFVGLIAAAVVAMASGWGLLSRHNDMVGLSDDE